MAQMSSIPLDMALIPPGTPKFADLIELLTSDTNLPETRRRDLISGLRRVAKALNRAPEDVPASGRWLQPRIAKIHPANLGVTAKAWHNAVSDARNAMAQCGLVERRFRRASDLTPEWQALWKTVLAAKDPTLPPSLCRFVHFLSRVGVSPAAVCDAQALAFREALATNEISKSPEVAYRTAVNGWNLATRRITDWPQTQLSLPVRQKRFRLPDEAFPAAFMADLEALLVSLLRPDPLADHGRSRALRPDTVFCYRRQLIRFASEVVHAGLPLRDLIGIQTLLEPANTERGLRQMLARTGNKPTKMISEVAALLRNLSRITGQSEAVQKRLQTLAAKVAAPPQRGMTRKNRDRLRALQGDKASHRLLTLPKRLFTCPPTGKANFFTKALAREDALAIAILLYCPIRVKNLAGIHLEHHIQRPGDGQAFLVLTEDDLKNERPLEFELPSEVVQMIDAHLKTRSPHLCPAGTPWLFPRRDGREPIKGMQLAARIKQRVRKTEGLEVNAHLFRHYAVMNWLDANPGGYEVARRLLGHSEVSHTINMYSGLEAKAATKLFADLIETKKAGPK